MALMCRINPVSFTVHQETLLKDKKERLDPNYKNEEIEWVVKVPNQAIPAIPQAGANDRFVCYGIMLRVLDAHPSSLPESKWWENTNYGRRHN